MTTSSTPSGRAAVHLRSYPRELAAHAHSFHQLVVPLAGRLELEVAGHGGHVEALGCVLVGAGERHAFQGGGANAFLVLDFEDAVACEAGASAWIDRTAPAAFFAAPIAVRRLAAVLADDVARGAATASVERAWATLVLRAAAAPAAARPAHVERALALLEARALGPLRVADLAHAAGVGPGHLHALFRRHVGRTPAELVLTRRLEAAHDLLRSRPDLPIVEIALRCGFADQPTLTRAMRRVMGTTPGAVRRAGG